MEKLHSAEKQVIQTGAGVVDYDYRGEVGVVLFNHGPEEPLVADKHEKISMAGCREVESLDETLRGTGGFGSTGISGEAPAKRQRSEAQDCAMLVKRSTSTAVLPVRGSAAAAGFDLAAAEATVIPAGGKGIVKTGLSIAIPEARDFPA
eukprot:g31492.t1